MTVKSMADFTSNPFTQKTVRIIEHNTQTQVNVEEKHKEVVWTDGLPTKVITYADSNKEVKLWTKDIYYSADGIPANMIVTNHDEGTTITQQVGWVDGLPVEVKEI